MESESLTKICSLFISWTKALIWKGLSFFAMKYDIVSLRPNCRNKSLFLVRLYLRLRGFSGNLRASNLDISVRIWAEEPRRFYGSPGGGVALKKHRTKPPESRGSLFPKSAQCLMVEDQGGRRGPAPRGEGGFKVSTSQAPLVLHHHHSSHLLRRTI